MLSFSKCEFWLDKVEFLGDIVSSEGISVDLAKVQVVANQERLKISREARSFLGLTGYYRRFLQDFSKISNPLTRLTMKNEIPCVSFGGSIHYFSLRIWRHYLYGENCEIYTDHKSLRYIFTQKRIKYEAKKMVETD